MKTCLPLSILFLFVFFLKGMPFRKESLRIKEDRVSTLNCLFASAVGRLFGWCRPIPFMVDGLKAGKLILWSMSVICLTRCILPSTGKKAAWELRFPCRMWRLIFMSMPSNGRRISWTSMWATKKFFPFPAKGKIGDRGLITNRSIWSWALPSAEPGEVSRGSILPHFPRNICWIM